MRCLLSLYSVANHADPNITISQNSHVPVSPSALASTAQWAAATVLTRNHARTQWGRVRVSPTYAASFRSRQFGASAGNTIKSRRLSLAPHLALPLAPDLLEHAANRDLLSFRVVLTSDAGARRATNNPITGQRVHIALDPAHPPAVGADEAEPAAVLAPEAVATTDRAQHRRCMGADLCDLCLTLSDARVTLTNFGRLRL